MQEQQHFQQHKNSLTAYPYPALSKGILRPPKMCSMVKGNQPNPQFAKPLPIPYAEALSPEAADLALLCLLCIARLLSGFSALTPSDPLQAVADTLPSSCHTKL